MSAHVRARRLVVSCAMASLGLLVGGCDAGSPTDPAASLAHENAADSEGAQASSAATLHRQLADLRRATARFHRFEEAVAAGHTVLVTHPQTGAACLEHSTEGAMGRHYLNPSLVDDEVSVTEPEAVIYEPMKNGRLRLVGFEYLIPFAIRGPEEAAPTLFGQEFLHNTTFDLWMLHVYAWKHNPDGIFATWNPAITCEHDDAVDG